MQIVDWIMKKMIPMKKYPEYLKKGGVNIGEGCEIYKSVNFGSEPYLVTLGENVRVAANVTFVTHDGGIWVLRHNLKYKERFKEADKFGRIIVGNNVHIGINAVIMPGVHIGDNSIIACNAVVTHNVVAGSVVGGVPARVIESIEDYSKKIENSIVNTKLMSAEEKRKFLLSLRKDIDSGIRNE